MVISPVINGLGMYQLRLFSVHCDHDLESDWPPLSSPGKVTMNLLLVYIPEDVSERADGTALGRVRVLEPFEGAIGILEVMRKG